MDKSSRIYESNKGEPHNINDGGKGKSIRLMLYFNSTEDGLKNIPQKV